MARVILIIVVALSLTGCGSAYTDPSADSTFNTTSETSKLAAAPLGAELNVTENNATYLADPVVAILDSTPLTQSELDLDIDIELFEMYWAIYELRSQALLKRVNRIASSPEELESLVDIHLDPPMPPRLTLPEVAFTQPTLGEQQAPITVSIFCNYESSHCWRMQKEYQTLVEHYGANLRFVFYDYVLPFHRSALPASVAARCADRLGKHERYHKALWAQQDNLEDTELYNRIAQQIGLDDKEFNTCQDDPKVHEAVRANVELAKKERFSNAPVTIINGLYVNGPKTAAILSYYIDSELKRLSISSADNHQQTEKTLGEDQIPESELPLRLVEVLGDVSKSDAKAWIQNLDSKAAQAYQIDAQLLPDVYLVLIEHTAVILNNSGSLERLTLNSEDPEDTVNKVHRVKPGNVSHGDDPIPDDLDWEYQGIVAPKGDTPLSREWLDTQLMNEIELAEKVKATSHQMADGTHLVRLEGVEENEFYKTLGLQEMDVIFRVNGKWVNDQQNDLYADLQRQGEVSLLLFRKGMPIHYRYVIE